MTKEPHPPIDDGMLEAFHAGFVAFGEGLPQKSPIPRVSGREAKLKLIKAWLRGWRTAKLADEVLKSLA